VREEEGLDQIKQVGGEGGTRRGGRNVWVVRALEKTYRRGKNQYKGGSFPVSLATSYRREGGKLAKGLGPTPNVGLFPDTDNKSERVGGVWKCIQEAEGR